MNKSKKNVFIIIGIIIVVIGLIGFFYSRDIEKNDEDREKDSMAEYYDENRDKVDLEMSQNVETKGYILEDGNLLVELTNLNDYAAVAKIYVEFFDENHNFITIEDSFIGQIDGGRKSYDKIRLSDELKGRYETYQIRVVLSYNSYDQSYYDNVRFISFDDKSGNLEFRINTKKNKKINLEWGILFYDENDNIINYDSDFIYDAETNKKIKEKVYFFCDSYAKTEVVLLYACGR